MTKQLMTLGNNVPSFLAKPEAAKLNQAAAVGTGGVGVNKISIKGGKFRLIVGGEEVKVLEKNSIALAVIRINEGVHKAYYSKKWTPGSDDPPDCYSNDGKYPAADAEKRQASACAGCKHNEWGSYVNPDTGAKGRACGDSKRLAVLPPNQLGNEDMPPYQLTVPAASMKSLGGMLSSLNNLSPPVPYNGVVVEVSFDTDASYPKLLFAPVDYLTADQYEESTARYEDEVTKACVGMQLIPTTDITDEPEEEEAPKPKPKAKAKPQPEPELDDDEPEEEEEAPKPKAKPRAKAKPKAEPEADADDFDIPAPKKSAKVEEAEDADFEDVPAAKAKPKQSSAPKATSDIDDVFGGDDWD